MRKILVTTLASLALFSLAAFGQIEPVMAPVSPSHSFCSESAGTGCNGQAGQNGIAGQADPDAALPPPIAVVPIRDVGRADAPVRLFGDAYAYVQHVSPCQVITWVEDTGLRAENVSDKVIVEVALETLWRDVRGGHGWLERHPMFVPLQPGDVWSQPFGHVPVGGRTMSTEEYLSGQPFSPTAAVHVTFVRFSDGSTYREATRH